MPPNPIAEREGSPLATPSRYELEKADGTRRPNGALKLKRLKPRHLRVLKRHLEGVPSGQIAQEEGVSDATISLWLHDPLSQEILARASANRDLEFEALYGMHLEALRAGFQSGDVRDNLRAASVYGRERIERKRGAGPASESAEDVIARMLQLNIQVNLGTGSNE